VRRGETTDGWLVVGKFLVRSCTYFTVLRRQSTARHVGCFGENAYGVAALGR